MEDSIRKKIESLPALPESVKELEDFRKIKEQEIIDLLVIVEKDPIIVSSLLKTVNSAMFGFGTKVETPSKAIHLLGIKFTLGYAIGSLLRNLVISDISMYNSDTNKFMYSSSLSTSFVNLWGKKAFPHRKEALNMPAFLQNIGVFVLAELIAEQDKESIFIEKIKDSRDISEIERELVGITTSELTSEVLKYWKLDDYLVDVIHKVDNVEESSDELSDDVKVLSIVKILCCISEPFSDKNIELAMEKANDYGLNIRHLEDAIEKMQDRLLEEE
ncbi:MAG: HDOD domain-containing protein [Patescibacteria group bacterium]|nr:HDOD domain-containing protein [Patescibacteria group bacterium]